MPVIWMCQREAIKYFLQVKGESSLPSKEKVSFADTAKIYGKKEPSIPETVKKEK